MRSSQAATLMSLEPWPIATSKRRPRAQRSSAALRETSPTPLRREPPAAVAPDGGVLDAEALAELQRLSEVTRRDLHLDARPRA